MEDHIGDLNIISNKGTVIEASYFLHSTKSGFSSIVPGERTDICGEHFRGPTTG